MRKSARIKALQRKRTILDCLPVSPQCTAPRERLTDRASVVLRTQKSAANLLANILGFLFLSVSVVPAFGGESGTRDSWKPPKYSKVVGYRFRLPSDDVEAPIPSGFTLLRKGSVDIAELERLAVKSVELAPGHVRELISAVNAKNVTFPAACYDPHHIFVFYSDKDTVVAALEVCFSCTDLHGIPAIAKPGWYRHDYVTLARLTDKLGLWMENHTVQKWMEIRAE